MIHEKSYLTPKEVAELLMVSTSAIRTWTEGKLLKAMVTAGGHRRFKLEDIQKFAKERNITLNLPVNIAKEEQIRILIFDDEPLFSEYLSDALTSESDRIVTKISPNGFDAGIRLHDFSPAIVLLDLYMPGIDGYRVCKQIKQNPEFTHIKVIAMTGNHNAEVEDMLISAGAEACIAKPFDMEKLCELLKLRQN